MKDESRLSHQRAIKKYIMENDKVLKIIKEVQFLPKDFLQENNIETEYRGNYKLYDSVLGWIEVESYYLPSLDMYKWQHM